MFVVCSSCQRHVRESDGSCPFCRASIVPLDLSPTGKPLRVVLAIAAASAALGCGKTNEPTGTLYGAPPVEMMDASTTPKPVETTMPPAPAYGAPPQLATDAGPPVQKKK
jgi:hypothetical protein